MSSANRQHYFRQILARSLGLCAMFASVYTVSVIAEENYVTAGSAYNLENNELIYRELYTGIDENQSVRVDYTKPDGSVFASKTLVYQGELFQPSFNYEDTRDNEFVSAQFQGARLVLTHGMNSAQNEKIIYDNARMVIDAGFDAYIQLNWDTLVAGKRLKFDFAMPKQQKARVGVN